MTTYVIANRADQVEGDGTAGQPLDSSEFVGAKPIRKHYQSAIRSLLDHHSEVVVTISNSHEIREFVISKIDD